MSFNTTNNTFRQLMGNGLSYRVPSFQRDYSWGADEWDDLWQDVVGLFGEDPEPAHYMGYLVLQSADNREFDVIDGQQRMTTLSLLMLAAISHLTDLAAPEDPEDPQLLRARQLRANYIGYLDPVSLVPALQADVEPARRRLLPELPRAPRTAAAAGLASVGASVAPGLCLVPGSNRGTLRQ